MHFITWMTFFRLTSTLPSSRNQLIQAIRIPKHLNAVSKIRLLKFSLDVTFLYYKHFSYQSCFKRVKSATKRQHIIFLNLVWFFFESYILPLLIVLTFLREIGLYAWFKACASGVQGFPHSLVGKESVCNAETQVQFMAWGDPLEKEMATHSSILAWRIPLTEEPGRLQSMGSQESQLIDQITTTSVQVIL